MKFLPISSSEGVLPQDDCVARQQNKIWPSLVVEHFRRLALMIPTVKLIPQDQDSS